MSNRSSVDPASEIMNKCSERLAKQGVTTTMRYGDEYLMSASGDEETIRKIVNEYSSLHLLTRQLNNENYFFITSLPPEEIDDEKLKQLI